MKKSDTDEFKPKRYISGVSDTLRLVFLWQAYANNLPLLGNDFVGIDDMTPGTGAVTNDGLQKLAVFKDEKGIMNKFSGTIFSWKNLTRPSL